MKAYNWIEMTEKAAKEYIAKKEAEARRLAFKEAAEICEKAASEEQIADRVTGTIDGASPALQIMAGVFRKLANE